jgi:AcrR family transcriptional regulator
MSTTGPDDPAPRKRADAVRNSAAVLDAAKAAFAASGIDAPMREIAARAGVGVGTIYRNYPQRSDLIIADFRRDVEATAAAAEELLDLHQPAEALRRWAGRLAEFIATKRGFSAALHSGDPAYRPLPTYFLGMLAPPVQRILDAGADDGSLRAGVRAEDLIHALSRLADASTIGDGGIGGMAEVLLDGLCTSGR